MSHLVAAAGFVVLGCLLLRRGWEAVGGPTDGIRRLRRERMGFIGVYAGACVLLFAVSGVYHMVARGTAAERVLLRLDYAAIFVLIAGTFTPAHGLVLRGWARWGPLGLIWAAAAGGIVLRTGLFEDVPEWVGLGLYLGMGWFGLVSAVLIAREAGWTVVWPLVLGGGFYSAGAVMENRGWWVVVPGVFGPHDLFHLAVIAGALAHWWFVWRIAGVEVPRWGEPTDGIRRLRGIKRGLAGGGG